MDCRKNRKRGVVLLATTVVLAACRPTSAGSGVDVALSTVVATPATAAADGQAAIAVTITVKDFAGAPIANREVALNASGTGNAITQPGLTNSLGVATGALASTVAETKILTVTMAQTGGDVTLTQQPSVAFASLPVRLTFRSQPGARVEWPTLSPIPVIAIEDALGQVVTSATTAVTLTLVGGPTGATLIGPTTVDAIAGLATFSDLEVLTIGEGYALEATAEQLTSATSERFEVVPDDFLPLEDQRSGIRIKAHFLASADGARKFSNWFDSQTGEPCFPGMTADQELRCLPSGVYGRVFSDADCSEPAVVRFEEGDCPASLFGTVIDSNACPTVHTPIRIAEPLNSTTTYYELDVAVGQCVGRTLIASQRLLPIIEEFAPSEFVAFTSSVEDIGGGLEVTRLVGSDGSVVHTGLRDASLGPCDPRTFDPSTRRCVPGAEVGISSASSDSACTKPAPHLIFDLCAPEFLRLSAPGGCASNPQVFRRGPRLETIYSGPSCEPVAVPDSHYYELGEEVPPSEFIELPDAPGLTHGQLREHRFGPLGGGDLLGMLVDKALELPCRPLTVADGTIRCAPVTPIRVAEGRFADPGCTQPVAGPALVSCGESIHHAYVTEPGCSPRYRVFSLTGVLTGPLFQGSPSACSEVGAGSYPYYVVGSELEPSSMVEFTVVSQLP